MKPSTQLKRRSLRLAPLFAIALFSLLIAAISAAADWPAVGGTPRAHAQVSLPAEQQTGDAASLALAFASPPQGETDARLAYRRSASPAEVGEPRLQLAQAPYLLADYAENCQAYLGKVPEFSCSADHENVVKAMEVQPKINLEECPLLFASSAVTSSDLDALIQQTCSLAGSVIGELTTTQTSDATNVTTLFGCRVYDTETKAGFFDDINVVQFDRVTGNTCWYNSAIKFALDAEGDYREDADGNVIYEDLDGSFVPSPMDSGADRFWLHPYHPDDVFLEELDSLENIQLGRRGISASINCQRCHDADAFIWTPIVSGTFPVEGSGLTSPFYDASPKLKFVSNFMGVFDADGQVRHQPARFDIGPKDTGAGQCATCHYLGANTMGNFSVKPGGGTGDAKLESSNVKGAKVNNDKVTTDTGPGRVPQLLHILRTTTQNDHAWMPPTNVTGYSALTDETTSILDQVILACSPDPASPTISPETVDINGISYECNRVDDADRNQADLTLDVVVSPYPVVAGQSVDYTVHIHNRGPDATTPLIFNQALPAGVTVSSVTSPNSTQCSSKNGGTEAECPFDPMAADTTVTVSLHGSVATPGAGDVLTNTVVVSTSATVAEINLAEIQVLTTSGLRRDADLSLNQRASMEEDTDNAGNYRLTYQLAAQNDGPAVSANTTFSMTLPDQALFDGQRSSPVCRLADNLVTCSTGQLADGLVSSVTVVASVPKSAGPIFQSDAAVSSGQPDLIPANNTRSIFLLDESSRYLTYLPSISDGVDIQDVDLIVKSIEVTDETAKVTIRNIGSGTLMPGTSFWVDLYIDPLVPPVGVNQLADAARIDDGLVWGVISPLLQLGPGDELTLEVGDVYYSPSRSRFPTSIGAGAAIYAQVDSANLQSTHGGVLETHEVYGGPYNNVKRIQLAASVMTEQWLAAAEDVGSSSQADESELPQR